MQHFFAGCISTGAVSVSYYPEHSGHDCELAHVPLRKEQREHIASKLAAGIPFDDVLDSVHLRGSASCPTSLQFVTKKDLHNITRDFGIDKGEVLYRNDADSVAAWIEKTKLDPQTQDLVRFVKFQGEMSSSYNLRSDDFVLVIASDAQLIGARQFCGPGKEVCLDSTHGLNGYDFQLTTLLGIDEHGEGYPVAFCYSSRVDECTMSVFLDVCKTALNGALKDIILMTDDTPVYSNAWNAVMGKPAFRLLCTWHIDRAWRKNLPKVKGSMELKAVMYKTVRSLMEMTDKDQFHVKMSQFLHAAKEDEKTQDFANYFENEYAHRPEMWAYSYRLGLKVHHNMHLEAMHRVIKHVHLQGRKVKRLDKSIHALLRFLRQKMSDRLLKLHRGKWTKHVRGIRRRHNLSSNIPMEKSTCLEENMVYTVEGANDVQYTVRQSPTMPHVSDTCPLACRECNACVHSFSCTCLDSALRNTICKHIHFIVRTYKPVRCSRVNEGNSAVATLSISADDLTVDAMSHSVCDDSDVPEVSVEAIAETQHACPANITESEAILNMFSEGQAYNYDQYIVTANSAWAAISATMESHPDLAKVAAEHLTRLQSLLKVLQTKPDVPGLPTACNEREPSNKRAATQRFFMSTKKAKRPRQQLTVSKPTGDEKKVILHSLGGNMPLISTQPPAEHDYSSDTLCHVINFEHSYAAQ